MQSNWRCGQNFGGHRLGDAKVRMETRAPVWRTVGKPVAVPATHRPSRHALGKKKRWLFGAKLARSYVVQTPPVPLQSVLQRSSSAAGQLMAEPMTTVLNRTRSMARPVSCEVGWQGRLILDKLVS